MKIYFGCPDCSGSNNVHTYYDRSLPTVGYCSNTAHHWSLPTVGYCSNTAHHRLLIFIDHCFFLVLSVASCCLSLIHCWSLSPVAALHPWQLLAVIAHCCSVSMPITDLHWSLLVVAAVTGVTTCDQLLIDNGSYCRSLHVAVAIAIHHLSLLVGHCSLPSIVTACRQ